MTEILNNEKFPSDILSIMIIFRHNIYKNSIEIFFTIKYTNHSSSIEYQLTQENLTTLIQENIDKLSSNIFDRLLELFRENFTPTAPVLFSRSSCDHQTFADSSEPTLFPEPILHQITYDRKHTRYVTQGDIDITSAKDLIPILGTLGAITCIILTAYIPGKQQAVLAHIDSEEFATTALERLDSISQGSLTNINLIGGNGSKKSQNLASIILEHIKHNIHYRLQGIRLQQTSSCPEKYELKDTLVCYEGSWPLSIKETPEHRIDLNSVAIDARSGILLATSVRQLQGVTFLPKYSSR